MAESYTGRAFRAPLLEDSMKYAGICQRKMPNRQPGLIVLSSIYQYQSTFSTVFDCFTATAFVPTPRHFPCQSCYKVMMK